MELKTESPTRRRVRAMTAAGVAPRDIGPALGISVPRVYALLKKMGLKPAPGSDEEAAS